MLKYFAVATFPFPIPQEQDLNKPTRMNPAYFQKINVQTLREMLLKMVDRLVIIRGAASAPHSPTRGLGGEGKGQAVCLRNELSQITFNKSFSSPHAHVLETVGFLTNEQHVIKLDSLGPGEIYSPTWLNALLNQCNHSEPHIPPGYFQHEYSDQLKELGLDTLTDVTERIVGDDKQVVLMGTHAAIAHSILWNLNEIMRSHRYFDEILTMLKSTPLLNAEAFIVDFIPELKSLRVKHVRNLPQ